jgi:hypothetical protein
MENSLWKHTWEGDDCGTSQSMTQSEETPGRYFGRGKKQIKLASTGTYSGL